MKIDEYSNSPLNINSKTSNESFPDIDSFLLDITSELIFSFDINQRIIKVNKAFCDTVQLTQDSIINKTFSEIGFNEDACNQMNKLLSEVLNNNKEISETVSFSLIKEITFSYQLHLYPIINLQGECMGVAVRGNNFYQEQEALKAERTLLRTIIDSVPESVYVKDASGGKVIANTQDLIYMGIDTEKEAIGKTDEDVYAKYNSAYFNKDDEIVIQGGTPVINKLDYFIDANNRQHWLLTSKVPIKNKDNEIIGLIGVGRDVTERQKILDELFRAQDRLRKIALSTSDWIWEVGSNGHFTYCSDSVEIITGWKPTEIIGQCILEFLFKEESKTHYLKDIFMQSGNLVDQEIWITHKDGSEICILINGYPNVDNNGKLDGYTGIIKNITDRKLKERSISELNERLVTLIEAMPDGVFFKDGKGRWLITNTVARKMFNLGNTEWIGKTDQDLAKLQTDFKAVYEQCTKYDNEAWNSGTTCNCFEEGLNADGEYFKLDVLKIPIFEDNGNRKGMVILAKDITEDLKGQLQLKMLSTGIEYASDAITIVEINQENLERSKIVYVNEACCSMFGYTKEEYIGRETMLFSKSYLNDHQIAEIKDSVKNGRAVRMEIRESKKNDEIIWTFFSLTPVAYSNGKYTHWISIKKDITEAKKHDQEIKKAIIKGQENEKYFISGELHDNVAQILIGAKLSLSGVKGHTEKEIENIEHVKKYINMSIDEIRNLSHNLAPSAYYQKDFINSITQLLKNVNKQNGYHIKFDYDTITDADINGELQLNIYRILQEQLQNIIKHAEATNIEVTLKMIENAYIRLTIKDDGIGFDMDKEFKGIGLQNIKNRAETFSGTYKLSTTPLNGCTVIVTIPIIKILS